MLCGEDQTSTLAEAARSMLSNGAEGLEPSLADKPDLEHGEDEADAEGLPVAGVPSSYVWKPVKVLIEMYEGRKVSCARPSPVGATIEQEGGHQSSPRPSIVPSVEQGGLESLQFESVEALEAIDQDTPECLEPTLEHKDPLFTNSFEVTAWRCQVTENVSSFVKQKKGPDSVGPQLPNFRSFRDPQELQEALAQFGPGISFIFFFLERPSENMEEPYRTSFGPETQEPSVNFMAVYLDRESWSGASSQWAAVLNNYFRIHSDGTIFALYWGSSLIYVRTARQLERYCGYRWPPNSVDTTRMTTDDD